MNRKGKSFKQTVFLSE